MLAKRKDLNRKRKIEKKNSEMQKVKQEFDG